MSFISSIRTNYLAWSHSTPLPNLPDVEPPTFQRWHSWDKSACKWLPFQPQSHHVKPKNGLLVDETSASTIQTPTLRLLTWNIDAFGNRHEARMDGILSKLRQMLANDGGPDIVFLQEVSWRALAFLLEDAWFRDHWISSEANETNWADVPFATMTLLSRSRFGALPGNAGSKHDSPSPSVLFSPGPVWRVKYPSRYKRDALCCDIFWNYTTRIRLINVHLDSLPIQPNRRPRQVAINTSLLRTPGVGRGVIAGDWNPVSEEDAALVQENRLIDAWECLHPGEDGFTWGLDGKGDPFPPTRLDKVAVLGLTPVDISIVHPETCSPKEGTTAANVEKEGIPWSDHSGLVCDLILE